jgi:hypothetical protein
MWTSSRTILLGLAVALGAGGGAAAQGFGSVDSLWVQPAERAGGTPGCARLLLADLPTDWQAGDAAVVVLSPGGGGAADGLRARLQEALLRQEAAVLDYRAGRSEADCPGRAAPALAEVFGATGALAVQAGAGLIVAIGIGRYGDAVLAATDEALAAAVLGPGGSRLAAAIAIDGPGRARFAAGPAPATAQGWSLRAPLLCAAIAAAAGLEGPEDCVDALMRGQTQASLVRPRR